MNKLPKIIAEVKTLSPFDGELGGASVEERLEIALDIGDVISRHTNAARGGSKELITETRELTDKPILAKGLHEDDEEIFEALERGADQVLVVGRIPEITHRLRNEVHELLLIEPHNLRELEEFVRVFPDGNYVWNSRDLRSGAIKDPRMFQKARELVKYGTLCQASNISSVADIQEGADSILVGTHLKQFSDSLINKL